MTERRRRVASSMVNVHGVAHGGVVFALATCQGIVHRRPVSSEHPAARP